MFFVSEALAAGEIAQSAGFKDIIMQILPLVMLFLVFWLFLIRPQQKRQKEHAKMCEALTRGDEVMTMGGLSGLIDDVDEQYIGLRISEVDGKPVVIRVQRTAIQTVLPKGTVKF